MVNFSEFYSKIRSSAALVSAIKHVDTIKAEQLTLKNKTNAELQAAFLGLRNISQDLRLVPGFAIVSEMAFRVLGQQPYEVQLAGGIALLEGKLAEMRTGEGKTLTIAAPAAIMALEQKGVHVVTANEYLAIRDCENLRKLYEALGISVSSISSNQTAQEKKSAYFADITYGVSSEFGFDYLKDNLATNQDQLVQRPLYAAIVDEVDYVLIDEAKIPLIIAESSTSTASATLLAARALSSLNTVDVNVNLAKQEVSLTESGYEKIEHALESQDSSLNKETLYSKDNLHVAKAVHAAIKAKYLFKKGRDYLVENAEIILIDPGTGRKMEGRRLEDGLHEALEALENLDIRPTSLTRASITFQCYFSLYRKLSGLTGTAATDSEEFLDVYGLDTVVVPTNKPVATENRPDLVFLTKTDKFNAVISALKDIRAGGQPVLVGCSSVRDAQVLSSLLTKHNVQHNLLTAKNKEEESKIISNAGKLNQITVTTNMAGRGTDIMLGGERPTRDSYTTESEFMEAELAWRNNRDKVIALGGLFVLGTERNGIRRVDNQLAGRCGRQGEVGVTQFYLSLEDDLLKNFGKSKHLTLARRLVEQSQGVLSGSLISKIIVAAQKMYELQGFSARKALRDFDNILGAQRNSVYELRQSLLAGSSPQYCQFAVKKGIGQWITEFLQGESVDAWDLVKIKKLLKDDFGISPPIVKWVLTDHLSKEEIEQNKLTNSIFDAYTSLALTNEQETQVLLSVISDVWTEHLMALDELNRGLALKSHTGFNPIFQFRNEAYALFEYFESEVHQRFLKGLFKLSNAIAQKKIDDYVRLIVRSRWVSRNERCPCKSGLAYKKCHGAFKSGSAPYLN